jgi:hypothetical protein
LNIMKYYVSSAVGTTVLLCGMWRRLASFYCFVSCLAHILRAKRAYNIRAKAKQSDETTLIGAGSSGTSRKATGALQLGRRYCCAGCGAD